MVLLRKNMKFSVIIPVYNVKPYLGECLDSILSQTYGDFEMILVDDGSTDGSGELCDRYAAQDARICVIHQSNQGLSAARNHGIAQAKGEYLMLVDSDDYLLRRNALELLAERADGCDLVAFDWREIPDGKTPEEGRPGRTSGCTWEASYPTGEAYLMAALRQARLLEWYAWKNLYKIDLWVKQKFEFPEERKFEDVALIPRVMATAQRVNIVAQELYGYRKERVGSITQAAKLDGERDKLKSAGENIRWVQENSSLGVQGKALLCDNLSCAYYSALIDAGMLSTNDRKQLIGVLKQEKWMCEYTLENPQKMVARLLKVLGYGPVMWMLNVRRIVRERKRQ